MGSNGRAAVELAHKLMGKTKTEQKPIEGPKLSDKEQRFVEAYCTNGYNKAKAARKAGYSEKTAKEIGYKLFTKVHIREAISKRLKELSLTDGEVLKGISDIANASLNDYFTIKQVVHRPQVKKPLSLLIAELQAKIEDAEKFMTRSGITEQEYIDKHNQKQQRVRLEILELEIQLERKPDAFRIEQGEPELVEMAELDLPKLVKDKEAGRIRSVKPTEFGLSVELYDASAALTNIARMHGMFEKDNRQQQAKITVKIGGKSVNGN